MPVLREIIDSAYVNGKNTYSTFRRVSSLASVAGYWIDLSMATGNPTPNYYLGNEKEATVPLNWYKKGIWHGGSVSPAVKYLHKMCLLGTNAVVAPAPFILCDYLMYYPIIDMDDTAEQILVNYTPDLTPTISTLPRYVDGLGVQAFIVATNPYIGGASFQIIYTNQDGVMGRTSQISITNTSTYIGTLVNSNTAGVNRYGAFIPLQQGDNGIRSVQSITFHAPNGGLACLVLVKPIATMMTREVTAWAEFDFIKDKPSLPVIEDGAYLNLLAMPAGSAAAIPVIGELTTIWE